MKTLLIGLLTLGTLFGQGGLRPLTANRITRGSGVPAAGFCAVAADVGKIYLRFDAQAVGSSLYSCDNTAAATFAWELVGTVITGAATPFSTIAAGTNANALVIGTNGSLATSGTGTIVATGLTGAATGTSLALTGGASAATYATATNCADSAGAAACGSAAAGAFVVDAASTATVVSTTAVTANSIIIVQEDSSLSTRLSITCNTQSSLVLGAGRITARTAATSFTFTLELGPTTNPACFTYQIID